MKKMTILSSAMTVCAVILLASFVMSVARVIGFAGDSYPHAGEYSSGDAEISGKVKNLDIEWLNGTVNLAYHNGEDVILKESSKKDISDEMRMRWRLDGDTLRVRYAKPGLSLNRNPEKELTVTLPKDLTLEDVHIGATSGTIMIPSVKAEHLVLEVTSGRIYAKADSDHLRCSSTSGSIDLFVEGEAEEITADTTSGDIQLDGSYADAVRLSATSGSVHAAMIRAGEFRAVSTSGSIFAELGEANKAEVECTSGSVHAKMDRLNALQVSSTSGNVSLSLPKRPGFTAKINTGSGNFEYQLPLTKQGSDYICGDGSGIVDIRTASGDIRITR